MSTASQEVLESDLGLIVNHIWTSHKRYIAIYSCINWTATTLFFASTVWFRHVSQLSLATCILCLFMLFFQMSGIYMMPHLYFQRMGNWVDLYLCFAMIAIAGCMNPDPLIDYTHSLPNLATSLTMTAAAIRALTYMKIVDGVRHFFEMMFSAFKDIRYFLIVLVFGILLFGAIDIQVSKTTPQPQLSLNGYANAVDKVYNLSFGNWGDSKDLNLNQYIHFLIGTLFIPLVMFNLLIAMIWEIFNEYTYNKTITEVRVAIQDLLDMNNFIRFVSRFIGRSEQTLTYLHLVVEINESPADQIGLVISKLDELQTKLEKRLTSIEQRLGSLEIGNRG